jgi:hypothetical protein
MTELRMHVLPSFLRFKLCGWRSTKGAVGDLFSQCSLVLVCVRRIMAPKVRNSQRRDPTCFGCKKPKPEHEFTAVQLKKDFRRSCKQCQEESRRLGETGHIGAGPSSLQLCIYISKSPNPYIDICIYTRHMQQYKCMYT